MALELEVGFKNPVLGLSAKMSKTKEETTVDNRCFGEVVARCLKEKYTLAMSTYELRKCLSDGFVQAVKEGDYESVFKQYGTHLISESYIGGQLNVSFHSKDHSRKTKEEIKLLAEESYKGMTAKQNYTSSTSISEFTENCSYSFSGIGGDYTSMPATFNQDDNYKEWAKSVNQKPAMYQVNNCIPIWELFEDKTIQGNLKAAYYKYFNKYLYEQRNEIPFVTNMRVLSQGNSNVTVNEGEIVTKTDANHGYANSDLNWGAGGKYIYLLYKLGTDQSKKITDVIIKSDGTSSKERYGYVQLPEDLNKGAKGSYIYVEYYRGAPTHSTGYQGFCTRNDPTDYNDDWEPIKDASGKKVIDLNERAGGDYIYLFGYRDPVFKKINAQIEANTKEIKKVDPGYVSPISSPTVQNTPQPSQIIRTPRSTNTPLPSRTPRPSPTVTRRSNVPR